MEAVAAMDEGDVNELLMGYKRNQLHEVWRKPDESDSNQDTWKIQEDVSLVVNYNNKDIVVISSVCAVR